MRENYENLKDKLVIFLQDYLVASGASGFVLGLSGGLDSAVVATLCVACGAKINALLMPNDASNLKNLSDAVNLCKSLNIPYQITNIQQILDSFKAQIDPKADIARLANLSARIRMCLLYDHSAKHNALVVGTSNKSELMLGYGTIYGDMACALNPIGQIYKSELFEFAKFLGVSSEIINKPPSADLWAGQTDEGELGYAYGVLDEVLMFIEKNGQDLAKLKQKFSDEKLINLVINRINKNKFKTKMPPIAQI